MVGSEGERPDALVSAAQALVRGDAASALDLLEPLAAGGNATGRCWELLGTARAASGDVGGAHDAFRRAAAADPTRASVHYNYAVFLLATGQLDDAVEEVQAAALLRPEHPNTRRLAEAIGRRVREARYVSREGFAVVAGDPDPIARPGGVWAQLQCVSCGQMNFVTARSCARCGSYLPEEREVVPVE